MMTISSHDLLASMRLGFGCSGAWAQNWHSESEALRILHFALEKGVRHFDTAGFYARGEAERRLGAGLKGRTETVFISSKTGTRYVPGGALKDFSERAIRSDVEASLRRLGRDVIDLVYLHGPSARQQEQGLEALARLKAEGKIRFAGVCGEGEGLGRAVEEQSVDAVMGVYNFLRTGHAPIFEAAKRKGIGVIAVAPLAQGLYRRGFFSARSPADLWRIARALVKNRRELAAARRARAMLESAPGLTPAQTAIAFVLANPAIDVAVTNSTSIARLGETLAALDRRLPANVQEALAASCLDARPYGP